MKTFFCRLCFSKLHLLLLAIEVRADDGKENSLAINPGPKVKLETATQGFFIAESAEEVKRWVKVSNDQDLVQSEAVPTLKSRWEITKMTNR